MVSKSLSSTLYPNDATRVRCMEMATVTDRLYSRPGRGLSTPAMISLYRCLQGTAASASRLAAAGRLPRS